MILEFFNSHFRGEESRGQRRRWRRWLTIFLGLGLHVLSQILCVKLRIIWKFNLLKNYYVISYRMYCSLFRIKFTQSTQIKQSQTLTVCFWTHYKFLYLLTSAVKLSNEAELHSCKFCRSRETFHCMCWRLDDVVCRTKRRKDIDRLILHILFISILKHWSMTLTSTFMMI